MPAAGEKYFFVSSLAKGLKVLELLSENEALSVSRWPDTWATTGRAAIDFWRRLKSWAMWRRPLKITTV